MMKASNHTAMIAGTTFLAGISLVFLVGELKGQGPLDPPGAPEPSMKSLQEISDQIAELGEFRESSGENVLILKGNRVQIYTQSGNWKSQDISGTVTTVVESEGHFLVLAGSRVYGFNGNTEQWASFNAGTTVDRAASSKGTFVFSGNSRAWGWIPSVGAFLEAPNSSTIELLEGSD